MLPQAATEYDNTLAAVTTTALRSVRALWGRMPASGNWERAWRNDVAGDLLTVLLAAQEATAASADAYVAAVLDELDLNVPVNTSLNIDAFIGVAGDGRPVESLTYGAVIDAATAQYSPQLDGLSQRQTANKALESGGKWLEMVASSLIADAARAAETTSTAQRTNVTGYVRMVSPGACSRCVVLAGKFFRWNTGFERHPKCHCRHIPATENLAGDMLTSPDAYFNSLPSAERLTKDYPDLTVAMRREAGLVSQEDVFTQAGAEAIRLGADVNQVVNARRGMQVAQVYGRKTLITTEGATARGVAGKSLGELAKVAGQRYRVSQTPRLMPETILAHAKSPEDGLRLLTRFGFVLN